MNSIVKEEVKPSNDSASKSVEMKRTVNKTTDIAPTVCKDGVCVLNWKPRRPGTAA
ncbi:MAG: hypothetical protein K2W95_03235 [Candidatus Obscuribacterales bacterium]|nr:hypothetical protein [Candidatus Obscuribacterales bacterium]